MRNFKFLSASIFLILTFFSNFGYVFAATTITTPNANSVYKVGDVINVTWVPSGDIINQINVVGTDHPGFNIFTNTNAATSTYQVSTGNLIPGKYHIELYSKGEKDAAITALSDTFTVVPNSQNHIPKISVTNAPKSKAKVKEKLKFTANLSDSDKDPLYWMVDWGEGTNHPTIQGSCPLTPTKDKGSKNFTSTHQYAKKGIYVVIGYANDCHGEVAAKSYQVTVR